MPRPPAVQQEAVAGAEHELTCCAMWRAAVDFVVFWRPDAAIASRDRAMSELPVVFDQAGLFASD